MGATVLRQWDLLPLYSESLTLIIQAVYRHHLINPQEVKEEGVASPFYRQDCWTSERGRVEHLDEGHSFKLVCGGRRL